MAQDKYDSEIAELEKQERQIKNQINNLKQLKAEMLCPHKVGDIITNQKGTRQAKISRITWGYDNYKMFGHFLKKDGTPGTQLRELYWFQWE